MQLHSGCLQHRNTIWHVQTVEPNSKGALAHFKAGLIVSWEERAFVNVVVNNKGMNAVGIMFVCCFKDQPAFCLCLTWSDKPFALVFSIPCSSSADQDQCCGLGWPDAVLSKKPRGLIICILYLINHCNFQATKLHVGTGLQSKF